MGEEIRGPSHQRVNERGCNTPLPLGGWRATARWFSGLALDHAAAFQCRDLFVAQYHFAQHRIGVLPERRRIALLAAGRARELGDDAGNRERVAAVEADLL